MQSRVGRLRAIDFMLRARNLLLALLHFKGRCLQLGFQFRHLQHGERLALMHNVANIDIDLLHVPAHLGVHIDDLEGLKLPGEGQHLGDIAALRSGNARCGHGRRGGFRADLCCCGIQKGQRRRSLPARRRPSEKSASACRSDSCCESVPVRFRA